MTVNEVIENVGSKSSRKVGKVALIGPSNAGKSTLLNAMMGTKLAMVSSKAQSTRQRILGVKTKEHFQIVFVDTPGLISSHNKKKNAGINKFLSRELEDALLDLDCVACVIDASRYVTDPKRISEPLSELAKVCHSKKVEPHVVVLNKIDTFDTMQILPLIEEASRVSHELFPSKDLAFIPTSAKKGTGVTQLEEFFVNTLEVGPELFPEDVETTFDDKEFVSEMIREKAFSLLHKELPYGLAVVCHSWKSSDAIETIHADIIVAKESHKPMVLGKGGSMLKKIGMRSRIELEKLYACKINLQLHVKVEKDWTDTRAGLQKLGYAA